MEFILTIVYHFADRPPVMDRRQYSSFYACTQAAKEFKDTASLIKSAPALWDSDMPPPERVTATCINGRLNPNWRG